jgi:hypothetical protein
MYAALAIASFFLLWGVSWRVATLACKKNGALQPAALGFLIVLLPMSVVFSVGMYQWKIVMHGMQAPVAQVPLSKLISTSGS